MSRYLVLLLFPSLLVIACADNLPTGTNWINVVSYDTALTDNSFLLTGAGFSGGRIDMSAGYNGEWTYNVTGDMVIITEADFIDYPGKPVVNMAVALRFPNMRGETAWENVFEKDPDSVTVYATARIGEKSYASVEGRTEVIFTRSVFNEITGRYSGTFVSAFGDTITIADGRFAVPVDQ